MHPLVFVNPGHQAHHPAGNPEGPDRVTACLEALARSGLEHGVRESSAADRSVVELVHDRRYLEELEAFCEAGGGSVVGDTYASSATFDVALAAAGACVSAVEAASGSPAACCVRPPGHHATSSEAMGFCFMNNAAIAARYAVESGLAERVAIVDFDVHHGNGTQDIFYEDGDVLYISIHQFPWYPYTGELSEVGEGAGRGMNVNIPLPAMSGDGAYLASFTQIVEPILRAARPQLLIVSAGFDAHEHDPISLQQVTTGCFGLITGGLARIAREVCERHLVMILEGGYNRASLAESFVRSLSAASAEVPATAPALGAGIPYAEHAVAKVAEFHRRNPLFG